MKRNLHNICCLHPCSLHRCKLYQSHINPEVVLVVTSSQLILLHQAPIQEQMVKVASLMELIQLSGPVHYSELEGQPVRILFCLHQQGGEELVWMRQICYGHHMYFFGDVKCW